MVIQFLGSFLPWMPLWNFSIFSCYVESFLVREHVVDEVLPVRLNLFNLTAQIRVPSFIKLTSFGEKRGRPESAG